MRRRGNRLVFLACSCVLVATGSALAQAPDSPETRVVPVSVIDRDGKAVVGLTAANFRGEFRGQPVTVLSVAQGSVPRRIAIVLDTSGGMARLRKKRELAWVFAEDVLLQLKPEQAVALFTFADGVLQHTHFEVAHEVVEQALSRAKAVSNRGSTRLHDAIMEILRRWPPGGQGDVLYLITDCSDNASRASREQAEIALASAGVRAYIVFLVNPLTRPEPEFLFSEPEPVCRRLAESSGGLRMSFVDTAAPDAVDKARILYESLNLVYQVEVELPQPVDKPRKWKLEVVDERGKKLKNIEVAYPRLLVPLSAAAANK
jgi:hypothetical protein